MSSHRDGDGEVAIVEAAAGHLGKEAINLDQPLRPFCGRRTVGQPVEKPAPFIQVLADGGEVNDRLGLLPEFDGNISLLLDNDRWVNVEGADGCEFVVEAA